MLNGRGVWQRWHRREIAGRGLTLNLRLRLRLRELGFFQFNLLLHVGEVGVGLNARGFIGGRLIDAIQSGRGLRRTSIGLRLRESFAIRRVLQPGKLGIALRAERGFDGEVALLLERDSLLLRSRVAGIAEEAKLQINIVGAAKELAEFFRRGFEKLQLGQLLFELDGVGGIARK